MLKQRILTALVLIPLVIAGVLLVPTVWFGILFGLVLLMAAEEWSKLAGLTSFVQFMGINHYCTNVFVSKKFLHNADIVATFEQMRCKGMVVRCGGAYILHNQYYWIADTPLSLVGKRTVGTHAHL